MTKMHIRQRQENIKPESVYAMYEIDSMLYSIWQVCYTILEMKFLIN